MILETGLPTIFAAVFEAAALAIVGIRIKWALLLFVSFFRFFARLRSVTCP
jgi:hypothetical protein